MYIEFFCIQQTLVCCMNNPESRKEVHGVYKGRFFHFQTEVYSLLNKFHILRTVVCFVSSELFGYRPKSVCFPSNFLSACRHSLCVYRLQSVLFHCFKLPTDYGLLFFDLTRKYRQESVLQHFVIRKTDFSLSSFFSNLTSRCDTVS